LLFLPDADGKGASRNDSLRALQGRISHKRFLYCAAVEEVEVWLMAGHKNRLKAPWAQNPIGSVPEGAFLSTVS
jgi:hypothetical protein